MQEPTVAKVDNTAEQTFNKKLDPEFQIGIRIIFSCWFRIHIQVYKLHLNFEELFFCICKIHKKCQFLHFSHEKKLLLTGPQDDKNKNKRKKIF